MKQRVILCDDDWAGMGFFKMVLDESGEYIVVDEATNVVTAFEKCTTIESDLILMDLNFGISKYDGIEVVKKILQVKPGLKIIIFTGEDDDKLLKLSIDAGAIGFLTKKNIDDLPAKIAHAISVAPKLKLALEETKKEIAYSKLSDQVRFMLDCVDRGMTQKEIAAKLGITQKAVETAIGRARKELKHYGIDI